LALNDDGVNARFVKQLAKQKAGGASANNGNLGAGSGHAVFPFGRKFKALSIGAVLGLEAGVQQSLCAYQWLCAIIAQIDTGQFSSTPASEGNSPWPLPKQI
jgi:hypothetical protein